MDSPDSQLKQEHGHEAERWSERVQRLVAEADDHHPLIHRRNFEKFVEVDYAGNWPEVQLWLSRLQGKWVYRGQGDSKWLLLPSLDRAVTKTITLTGSGLGPTSGGLRLDPQSEELNLLQEFQRRAHHYAENVPAADETVDWLALMQHYGAPTRLLDWTYSPYVALYFAVENSSAGSERAVWAIASGWLVEASRVALQEHDPAFVPGTNFRTRCEQVNRIILCETNPSIVILANPLRMNERLAAQQGVFLCNLSHIEQFDISLLRMIALPKPPSKPVLRKLVISDSARIDLLKELQRMNITGASLFPGMDGLSRTLRVNLEIELDAMKRQIEDGA
jgi:hypothetical protein